MAHLAKAVAVMPASKPARTLAFDTQDWDRGRRGSDGALGHGWKGTGEKGERGRRLTPF
jgi:hypothetical protein